MPSPSKPSTSKHHQRHSDATWLRGLMDRKSHNFSWPYSYPPFTPGPGWFSVNGVGYQPHFPGGGGGNENVGVGVPIWFSSPDLRGIPSMPIPRQQPPPQAQEASGPSPDSANNDTAAAAAAVSPPRSSPPAGDHANNSSSTNTTNTALVPSHPTSPMTVDAATQCLSSQLHDAIKLCTESLKLHAHFVANVHFTTAETRNGVWKDLLKHKFKSSGFLHDGFHNLGRRLAYYMEQAHRAAQNDLTLESGEQAPRREAQGRARRLRVLRATCEEVVRLSDGASVDVLDCKEMLGLMNDMKAKLDRHMDGLQDKEDVKGDGEEDGNPGDAPSPEGCLF